MKIVRLVAENIKKIKAIDITPQDDTIIISGKNAQGKTSVLDSIWYALGGAKNIPGQTIRKGENRAEVNLDLGDLRVKRVFTPAGTRLEVSNADGAILKSPQDILDKLLGQYTFDPLEFARQESKKQKETLIGLVSLPMDLDELAEKRKGFYDKRTAINKEHKELEAQVKGMPVAEPGLPEKELSSEEVMKEFDNTMEKANERWDKQAAVSSLQENIRRVEDEIRSLREKFKELQGKLEHLTHEKKTCEEELAGMEEPDVIGIKSKLSMVEETNKKIRAAHMRASLIQAAEKKKADADRLTREIDNIDQIKEKMMKEAQFPIDGLGFDELGITYQGFPFDQSSDSEKLKISLAIAMFLNPKLRVIRITDGSLLDSENMEIINQMARDNDYQIWIEVVNESGQIGIYIEDGEVK